MHKSVKWENQGKKKLYGKAINSKMWTTCGLFYLFFGANSLDQFNQICHIGCESRNSGQDKDVE